MKRILPAVTASFLCTALSTLGCHLVGMSNHDLVIAAAVTGAVSLTTALTVALCSKAKGPTS